MATRRTAIRALSICALSFAFILAGAPAPVAAAPMEPVEVSATGALSSDRHMATVDVTLTCPVLVPQSVIDGGEAYGYQGSLQFQMTQAQGRLLVRSDLRSESVCSPEIAEQGDTYTATVTATAKGTFKSGRAGFVADIRICAWFWDGIDDWVTTCGYQQAATTVRLRPL